MTDAKFIESRLKSPDPEYPEYSTLESLMEAMSTNDEINGFLWLDDVEGGEDHRTTFVRHLDSDTIWGVGYSHNSWSEYNSIRDDGFFSLFEAEARPSIAYVRKK